jgi:flagellar biosynthesis/type III secretory pathway protein FliH
VKQGYLAGVEKAKIDAATNAYAEAYKEALEQVRAKARQDALDALNGTVSAPPR